MGDVGTEMREAVRIGEKREMGDGERWKARKKCVRVVRQER